MNSFNKENGEIKDEKVFFDKGMLKDTSEEDSEEKIYIAPDEKPKG